MRKANKTNFHLYRYQILPLSRSHQQALFDDINSIEELIEQKNRFFSEALLGVSEFAYSKSELTHKLRHQEGEFYLFKFGVYRAISREKKDFTAEELDNWPSFFVGIWNSPDKQFIFIEERSSAFQHSSAFVKILQNNLNDRLSKRNLTLEIEPLFEDKSFWEVVDKFRGKVQSIEFELITPNMANISGALSGDLKTLAKSTDTIKTNLKLNSSKSSHLNVTTDNSMIDGLVDYSSSGGGDIKFSVRGLKKKISLGKTVKTIQIDNIESTGINTKDLSDLIKSMVE